MLACNLCSKYCKKDKGGYEEDVQFICRACRNIYDTTAGLYEHLKRIHKISVLDDSDSSMFHYCGGNKF